MQQTKGKLYLIPTPIGNLSDVSTRQKEAFELVDYVACEDTRNTKKLLQLLGIQKPFFSCHEHNEQTASETIINDLLAGKNVGYSSDAGLPCISDPGMLLVMKAAQNDITVVPLPGANAALTCLMASGLDTTHFYFYGFLDSRISKKETELEGLKDIRDTIIFYESPHRIDETLSSLYKVLGDRRITIGRELTKVHEEFIRTNLKDLIENPIEFRGEMVLCVEGNTKDEDHIDLAEVDKKIDELIDLGLTKKDAIIAISHLLNISKNELKKLRMKK